MSTKMLELLDSAIAKAMASQGGRLQDAIGEMTQKMKTGEWWFMATDCDEGLQRMVRSALRYVSRSNLYFVAFHTCGRLIAIGAISYSEMTRKKWDRFTRDVFGKTRDKSEVLIYASDPEWCAKVLAHIQAGKMKEIAFGEMN